METKFSAASNQSSNAPISRITNPSASAKADHASPLPVSRRTALAMGATAAAGVLLAPTLWAADGKRRVVVWSEGTANVDPSSKQVYPQDINTAIAEGLKPLEAKGWEIVIASLNDPDQGLSDERLNGTDVLIW